MSFDEDADAWSWITRHGIDEVLVHTLVGSDDLEAVLVGFGLSDGTREVLTAVEAYDRRYERDNQPAFQVRLCPLGGWTLVMEEGTAVHLEPWPAALVRPAFAPGVAHVRVEWTLNTGIGVQYRSGVPGQPASWYGDVLGPPVGLLARVAEREHLVHDAPGPDDDARLLRGVARDLAIPSVSSAVLRGPLLTVTHPGPLR